MPQANLRSSSLIVTKGRLGKVATTSNGWDVWVIARRKISTRSNTLSSVIVTLNIALVLPAGIMTICGLESKSSSPNAVGLMIHKQCCVHGCFTYLPGVISTSIVSTSTLIFTDNGLLRISSGCSVPLFS